MCMLTERKLFLKIISLSMVFRIYESVKISRSGFSCVVMLSRIHDVCDNVK
jgi:hypothetical protein